MLIPGVHSSLSAWPCSDEGYELLISMLGTSGSCDLSWKFYIGVLLFRKPTYDIFLHRENEKERKGEERWRGRDGQMALSIKFLLHKPDEVSSDLLTTPLKAEYS